MNNFIIDEIHKIREEHNEILKKLSTEEQLNCIGKEYEETMQYMVNIVKVSESVGKRQHCKLQ